MKDVKYKTDDKKEIKMENDMENVLKQSKEKIEKFAFGKDGENGLYQKAYKESSDYAKKVSLISGTVFFILIIVSLMIKTFELDVNEIVLFMSIMIHIFIFITSIVFLTHLSIFIIGLFLKEKVYILNKNKIKINKLKEKELSLQELIDIKPLIVKMKENLSKQEFFELMKITEMKTSETFGNAYYFFYLIENYEEMLEMVKERQKYDESLNLKLDSFLCKEN